MRIMHTKNVYTAAVEGHDRAEKRKAFIDEILERTVEAASKGLDNIVIDLNQFDAIAADLVGLEREGYTWDFVEGTYNQVIISGWGEDV
jgi:phenylpyruvate tautomerase PptA (4-oxalocrotonate tautomerase family)